MLRRMTLVAGTWEHNPAWIEDAEHPFQLLLNANGFRTARDPDHVPYRWSALLGGIPLLNRGVFEQAAIDLVAFIGAFPYRDLNLLAFSHGGQPAIMAIAALAKQRIRVRSLVTIGTPVRADVPAAAAAGNVDCWLHIIDRDKDLTALHPLHPRRLGGSLFDGKISLERRFLLPGVQNILVPNIHHGDVIKDPSMYHLWTDQGWFQTLNECSWRDQT